MKFSETVAEVVDLATAVRDYWNTELPKRHPNYPLVSPGEDSGPPPPEEAKLRSLLEALPDEEIMGLLLLMSVGRGDFGTDDLAMHYRAVKDRFCKREWAIVQLERKATLAEYLADGMAELKKDGIDLERLEWMRRSSIEIDLKTTSITESLGLVPGQDRLPFR